MRTSTRSFSPFPCPQVTAFDQTPAPSLRASFMDDPCIQDKRISVGQGQNLKLISNIKAQ